MLTAGDHAQSARVEHGPFTFATSRKRHSRISSRSSDMLQNAPPYDKDADELARLPSEAMKRYAQALAFDQNNRNEALEDLKFRAGEQWDERDKQERLRRNRPTVTHNRLGQFVKQVTGEVRRNRPGISCSPGDAAGDSKTAQVFEGLIRSVERLSSAPRVYSRALDQAVTCGMGHMRLSLEYVSEDGFDTELRIRTIRNPFSVVWDPNSVEDDKSDARECWVSSEVDRGEFKRRYPNASAASGFPNQMPISSQADFVRSGADTITVCENWQVKDEPAMLVEMRHPSGGTTILRDPDEQILAEAQQAGFKMGRTRRAVRKRICMHLITGSEVLEGPHYWPGQRIPVFTVSGEEVDIGDTTYRHGLIRFAKDAQRTFNYHRSMEIEMAGLQPKVPWLLPAESIEGYEDDWETANSSPKPYLRFRAIHSETGEPLPTPRREQSIGTSPGLSQLAQASVDDMQSAIGIYSASLGRQSNETSGRAIALRDQQADTGSYVYIDNLITVIEAIGRELVNVIPHVYSTREQAAILGADDVPAIIDLAREGIDLNRGKYDVVVQTGPAFQTRRQEAASGLRDLARSAPPPFLPSLYRRIAKLEDWPDAEDVAREIEQIAIQAGLMPPPMGGPPGSGPMPAPGQPMPPGAAPPAGPPNMPPRPPQSAPPGMQDIFRSITPAGAPALSQRVDPRLLAAGIAGNLGVKV